jgi:ABC-type polar amino acid transport system ATPase subunit
MQGTDGATSDHLIAVRGVHKYFGLREALRGVDLAIEKGETVCILGPSGSGKTTLLRCLNLLEVPSEGELHYEGRLVGAWAGGRPAPHAPRLSGRQLARYRSHISMVFQHFELFPHLTVLGNVTLGPIHALGTPAEEAKRRGLEFLDRVGLADYAPVYPQTLSGGQQQRVAIARALAMNPALILFDEPTSALDPELVGEVLEVMQRMAKEGITMAVVTHELGFAQAAAHRVVVMDAGVVIEEGSPETMFSNPQHPRTREFLRSILSTAPHV